MTFSHDLRYFFTCGEDGNLFSFKFNPEDGKFLPSNPEVTEIPRVIPVATDLDYETLSLEEAAIKAEYDKQMMLANEHKSKVRSKLTELEKDLTKILEQYY